MTSLSVKTNFFKLIEKISSKKAFLLHGLERNRRLNFDSDNDVIELGDNCFRFLEIFSKKSFWNSQNLNKVDI